MLLLLSIILHSSSALRLLQERAGDKELVYDVGMNDGSDALHYLKKGYRVVSVEANPLLVKSVSKDQRFQPYLKDGSFKIESKAIGETDGGNLTFYTPKSPDPTIDKLLGGLEDGKLSGFGTTDKDFICKCEKMGQPLTNCCNVQQVEMISCDSLLKKHGVPIFMKIDVEGHDGKCLASLRGRCAKELPQFITYEDPDLHPANEDAAAVAEYVHSMGYTDFKNIQEKPTDYWAAPSSPYGWGDELTDFKMGKKWKTKDEALEDSIGCGIKSKHVSKSMQKADFWINGQFGLNNFCNYHARMVQNQNPCGMTTSR